MDIKPESILAQVKDWTLHTALPVAAVTYIKAEMYMQSMDRHQAIEKAFVAVGAVFCLVNSYLALPAGLIYGYLEDRGLTIWTKPFNEYAEPAFEAATTTSDLIDSAKRNHPIALAVSVGLLVATGLHFSLVFTSISFTWGAYTARVFAPQAS